MPRIQPSGLQGLQNGAAVEVSGFADAAGDIVASRVNSVGDSGVARVVGTVQNLDPQQKTFNMQSLSVSYANAVVQGTLADGDVRCGTGSATCGQWRAERHTGECGNGTTGSARRPRGVSKD